MATKIAPSLEKEKALLTQGFFSIAGIDEAGRGAWAGPVVAAAVILPINAPEKLQTLVGVKDSKQMTAKQRDKFFDLIYKNAIAVGVGVASPKYIDEYRIVAATKYAMTQAVSKLSTQPQYLLIDAVPLPHIPLPQNAFYKADNISLSVAAASVIAKVSRDRLMVLLSQKYPDYGFERHKGYGTKYHQQQLKVHRVSKIHRRSFAPIQALISNFQPQPTD